ncbi:hypothetical protein DPMN_134223 [Dreissena polymorpha]|uniref:Uncharacterized protein n=1 Tax=Dreissena polymorpha TaxID=45954 RepID=A0A9D4FVU9_DREPO|nr:hypothetical protein DPMN_134223 [Dreissena polymorpha]
MQDHLYEVREVGTPLSYRHQLSKLRMLIWHSTWLDFSDHITANAEPAQHSSAKFQIRIRFKSVTANAEPVQHSSATF